jgi:hypothetical protein
MDQDEAQQACVDDATAAGDAAVCQAPPADASAAASAAPNAGDAGNPLLASVPAGTGDVTVSYPDAEHDKQMAEMKEGFETADGVGKVADMAGTMDKLAGGGKGSEIAGGIAGGLLGLPGDILAAANGVSEFANGDQANGTLDAVTGAAGVVGDVASMADSTPVGAVAGGIKGGVEVGKGAGQIFEGATSDAPAPGTSAKDGADEVVDGVENVLKGAGDGAAAFGPEGAAVGKALNGGMALGNAIAPLVFGDKNEAMDNQTADGEYHASTGNGVVDWVAGIGKYSNGRFGE